MIDSYKTIKQQSEGVFKDRASKFIAMAIPVNSENEVNEHLREIRKKYYDATHHCYAFRLGHEKKLFRAADDGEPSNSAGQPILGQIRSFDLTDILIVVIRYYGGTKLGVPGLINAYKTASYEALNSACIIEKFVTNTFELRFEYMLMNDIMRIIKEEQLDILEQTFNEKCVIRIAIRLSSIDRIAQRFKKINKLDFLQN